MNEDELGRDILSRFGGRIVLALGAAAAIGFILGAVIF